MLAAERRKRILEELEKVKVIKALELAEKYEVGVETIRRDFDFLEKQGDRKKIYGGATLHQKKEMVSKELDYKTRMNSEILEKIEIAKKAVNFIEENDTIFLNDSSTNIYLAKELKENAEILGDSFGGFTFSGGEPLAQPKFLIELMNELKDYHLCIETSGYAKTEVFSEILEKLDFVIMDIKIADSELHKKYTGVSNSRILENFETLRKSGKPYLIRTPLIPNITDTKENLDAIKELIGASEWERLPYNKMAGAKYKMLGMSYEL